MKASFDASARRRPVNLTLNEDLVHQAKAITENLSGLVEQLLIDFVGKEQRDRLVRAKAVEETVALWNQFNIDRGSFADEYSTL
jgi:antitoxin CcdA